jgi:GNAT superfamily N-acetyltransferase
MNSQIQYRRMKHGDERKASDLISGVFLKFVAPGFSQEGIDVFMKYIKPKALEIQLNENNFAFIASIGDDIIGVIEVRNYNHIALFFVDARFQRKGIGKELLRISLEVCVSSELQPSQITVNASPNSKKAYEKMGFEVTGVERCVNGIRFVPMVMHPL